jgi:hypothetical protein
MDRHTQYLQDMLQRVHGATSAVQLGSLEQTLNVADRQQQAYLSQHYPGWFSPEGVEPIAVNIDSPTYHIQSPAGVRTGPQWVAAPAPPPRRPLWPWLIFAGVLGAAIPLLLEHLWPIGRQTVTFPVPAPLPPVIHLPEQPPPVINLPPAPEPVDPGRYFLRPGQPLDR